MKVQCLEKVRDNSGNIKAYTLQDESGRVFQASGEQIKAEMKAKRYEFTNLQLDSIGRLIDKVDKNDIGRLHQEFEKAYQNLMSGKELGFGCIDIGSDFQNFDSNHSLVRVVDDHDDFREKYMTDIINQFEGYVLQKGGRIPYKLHVKSKDGVFEEVLYSLKDNMDMSVSDLINNLTEKNVKKELSNPKYYNADNYMVRAYRLDCPHQLIQNIFIAPDMSKVAMNYNGSTNKDIGNDPINKVMDIAYKMLERGSDIGFGFIKYNGQTIDLMSEKRINEALKKFGVNMDPIEVAQCFENYIVQSGGKQPNKLHVKSKDGAINMINYCFGAAEIKLKGFIEEYAGGQEKYMNPDNYIINSSTGIVYNTPDMSIVSTKGQSVNGQGNSGASNKGNNTDKNGNISGIEFLKKFSLRRLQIKIKRFFLSNFFVSLLKK